MKLKGRNSEITIIKNNNRNKDGSKGWQGNWNSKDEGAKKDDSKGQGWNNANRTDGYGQGYKYNENTGTYTKGGKDPNDTRKCYICDRSGHSWMYCRDRKSGNGCLRCGSSGHRLVNCPQRPDNKGNEQEQKSKEEEDDLLAYRMELKVMDIDGAPEGSRLLYYPVRVRSHSTKALLDSGASVNCIDADIVNRVGGHFKEKTRRCSSLP